MKPLRLLAYAGTAVIALDRLKQAKKTRDLSDYVIAGGIIAGLVLEAQADIESDDMSLATSLAPRRIAPVGQIAGIANTAASAVGNVTSSPGFWSQFGNFALDVAKNTGTAALSAWVTDEITDSGGGTVRLVNSGGPIDYRAQQQQPSGISTGAVVGIAAGAVGLLAVVLVATRR